ncbi:hypothetical protein PV371_39265, partial [Streptomyces sp. TX20-6-3]|uniref:hypothetical protein n=1 Tax=Streptomyces sp. TX20-6-3 TaxID=3028705 RepID=UPI0029B69977
LFLILVRHAGSMTTKGWGIAAGAWSVLAVLFLGVTVWAGALGLVRLGLAGDEVQVRLSQCRLESSRSGSHVECSGRLVGDVSMNTVTVRYDGKRGDVVPAARTPWGAFEVVDKSFTSWGTAVLYPLLPLVAAAVTSYFALRSGRRGKRQTAPSAP